MRLLNVEVVVTDHRGERVHDLPPEAFELLLDGSLRSPDFFTEVRDRQTTRGAGQAPIASGSRIALRVLVFVDDLFAIGPERNRALTRIEEQLDELRPGDELALVAFDGRRLSRLTGWSSDREILRQALARARRRPARGLERLAAFDHADDTRRTKADLANTMIGQLRNEVAGIGGDAGELALSVAGDFENLMHRGAFMDQPETWDRDLAAILEDQTAQIAHAATAALRSLSGGSARKAMLLLSGGWPQSALAAVTSDGDKTAARTFAEGFEGEDREALFRPLTELANTLGFTLYPVDVAGIDRGFGGAEWTPQTGGAYAANVDEETTTVFQLQEADVQREDQAHLSLDYLARQTGGLSLLNAQRDIALAELARDTRSFYWLGVALDSARDDTSHRLVVRLKPELRRLYRVRSRQSYTDTSERAEATQIVEAGLLFGDTSGAGPLFVELSPPRKKGRNRIEIDLEVRIPLDQIEMLDLGARYFGQLEVRLVTLDERGNRSATSVEELQIDGVRKPRDGDYYTFASTLLVKRRSQRLQIAVHDKIGQQVLASSSTLFPNEGRSK